MNRKTIAALIGLSIAGGCTVGPNYKQPEMKITDRYAQARPTTEPAATTQGSITTVATTQVSTTQPISLTWWTTFNDPALDRLIDDARRGSLDLRAAEARVRQARAERGVVAADQYPNVDAVGGYSRSRASKNVGNFFGSGNNLAPTETDLWQAGFDASWEIDVFGRVRREIEAANADIRSAIFDRNDVLLSLLAEVARNYVELRGFQRQSAIAQENVKAQQVTLDLTRAKFNAGLSNDVDVARSEAQVASTQSQIPQLQQQADQAIHRLSVLTGKEPQALLDELRQPAELPAPPPQVPVGLPTELLRRRPDIRRAEANLASATAQVGVATADLFPRFTLNGQLGTEANKFARLGDSPSLFWSIGPGVSWPIFNAGRIRNQIRVQEARTDQFLAAYEQTVLNSLEEVENALVAYRQEFVRRESLAAAVSSNQRAVRLSQQLYQRGLANFLDVLDAQRALYLSQDLLAQSDTTVSSNAVALFKALGGGWENPNDQPQNNQQSSAR